MGSTAPFVIDISGADWAEEPGDVISSVLDAPPGPMEIRAPDAPGLSAYQAQILLAIVRHARGGGREVSFDLSEQLSRRLALLGLGNELSTTAGGET